MKKYWETQKDYPGKNFPPDRKSYTQERKLFRSDRKWIDRKEKFSLTSQGFFNKFIVRGYLFQPSHMRKKKKQHFFEKLGGKSSDFKACTWMHQHSYSCLLFLEKMINVHYRVWKTNTNICHTLLVLFSCSLSLLRVFQRADKAREYDLFVLKIQKLEKLCNILQKERVVLYAKIKQVRTANSSIPAKVFGSSNPDDVPDAEGSDKGQLTPGELQEIQEDDPVLTEDMSRLREQQTKLQEFADSLFATTSDNDDEKDKDDLDTEEDLMASAFGQFTTKTKVKKEVVSVPEQVVEVKSEAAEPVLPKPAMSPPEVPTPVENTSEMMPANTKQEAVQVHPQVEKKEVEPVKPAEEIQQQPAEAASEPERVETNPPTDLKTEAAEAEISVKTGEVKPVIPVEEEKVQAEPAQAPEEAPTKTESANSPETTASSNANSSKKQAPKKKKKRTAKNAS